MQIRRILVPLDFSEPAEAAFRYAEALGERCDARMTLLHVTDFRLLPAAGPALANPAYQAFLAGHFEEDRHESRRRLESLAADARVPCRVVLREGNPAVEILAEAREGGHDLVVLASRGAAGLGQLLMGHTAEKVMRKAPCPVLVVPMSDAVDDPSREPSAAG